MREEMIRQILDCLSVFEEELEYKNSTLLSRLEVLEDEKLIELYRKVVKITMTTVENIYNAEKKLESDIRGIREFEERKQEINEALSSITF